MSAIAAYVWPDIGITIASDGITYDGNGIVKGFVSKVLPVPELSCVIGNTGAGGFAGAVRDALTLSCKNFDDALVALSDTVKAVHATLPKFGDRMPHGTLLVGGWSDRRNAFAMYKIHTRPREMINAETGEQTIAPPGIPIEINGGLWCSHAPRPESMNRFGLDSDASWTADELLSRYVCACRADSGISSEPDNDSMPYYVGGFLQLTTLRKDRVNISIIHRWPDKPGEVLDPNNGEPMPLFPLAAS